MKFKRLVALLLCFIMVFPFVAIAEEENEPYRPHLGFEFIAENENFEMFADSATGMFFVRDKRTLAEFHSRPVDFMEDTVAMGINRAAMSSLITIRTLDFMQIERIFPSSTESAGQGNMTFTKITNGFEANFLFIDQAISVLVRVFLTDDGFRAELPNYGLIEHGFHTLTQVQLMPFFGAGQAGEEGYVFIPDGSGALVEFDAIFSLPHELIRPFYGQDAAMASIMAPAPDEVYRLPVFGIRRNNQAFLAVIDEGAPVTTLSLRVGGDTSKYFRTMPNLIYRERHTMVLFEDTENERSLLQPSPRRLRHGLAIDYILLSGEDVDYSAMAVAYRNYLLERNMLARRDTSPFLDLTLTGAIRVNRNFLGIPYQTLQPLTTFPQALQIAEYFEGLDIDNIHLNLVGFNRGGQGELFNRRVQPERRLGGRRGLSALIEDSSDNINITYAAELINVQRRGNGFSPSRHAARNISGGVAQQFFFNTINRLRDYTRIPRLILSPLLIPVRVATFIASLLDFDLTSVIITGLGSTIHGDYAGANFTTRDESLVLWQQTIREIVESGVDFVADGGNAYVLPYASRIVGIPMGSSGFRMTTREVPFYQIVIHGFIPYSGVPVNMAEGQRQSFLRMIEYGAWPSFSLFYAESTAIRGNDHFRILSGNYRSWTNEARQTFATMQEFYRITGGSPMVRHERIMPLVYAVTYENGAVIIVNYRDEDIVPEGFETLTNYVPARGYRMIGGVR